MSEPRPSYDWRVFSDATCAGLSVLIPVPLLDLAFERWFRHRMPAAICRVRGVAVESPALRELGRSTPLFSSPSCLTLPFVAALFVLKRLSRKILYFLTVREAANKLAEYWHRAYLLDHMARADHLAPGGHLAACRAALDQTLEDTDTEALSHVARQVVRGADHVFRTLRRARRDGAATAFSGQQAFLADQWSRIEDHLAEAIQRYDLAYAAELAAGPGGRASAALNQASQLTGASS